MGQLQLIITADYEVFGNGTGSVDCCMIQPTNTLLDICDQYGAKLTLFVDVNEYWAFKETHEKGLFENNENPALVIENQLKDAIKRGHDVQLHFHPQWIDYKYLGNGNWDLNYDYWRLPNVPDDRLKELFVRGKQTLENILKPINPTYECNTFRAGGWCIQPEKKVLEIMTELGFKHDSTVAPNAKYDNGITYYDFSNAPDLPYWNVKDNVLKENEGGSIKEVPIFTTKVPSHKMAWFTFLRVIRSIPAKPKGCNGNSVSAQVNKQSKLSKLFDLLSGGTRMLNFSDAVTTEEMKYITRKAYKKYKSVLKQNGLSLVMIGHPKTFGNENEFKKYLAWLTKQPFSGFSTYK